MLLPLHLNLQDSAHTNTRMTIYARPRSDVTANWTNVGGESSHWESTNDGISHPNGSTDDATYIENAVATTVAEVRLQAVHDPETDQSHILSVRAKAFAGGPSLTLELIENTTSRFSVTFAPTASWATYSSTLTEAQANAITDYTNLRVRLTNAASKSVGVSEIEFALPPKRLRTYAQATYPRAVAVQVTS
jgi:hypothetical protein